MAKLVRDNIPDIIASHGETARVHIATDEEYRAKLREKLREEVKEFLAQPNEEEAADIWEVLDALIAHYGLSRERARQLQQQKAAERGRFEKKIILDEAA